MMLTRAGAPMIQSQNRITKRKKKSISWKEITKQPYFFFNLLFLVGLKRNRSLEKHFSFYNSFLSHSFLSYVINTRLPLLATAHHAHPSSRPCSHPSCPSVLCLFSRFWLQRARGQEQAETDQTDKARSLVSKQGERTGWNYPIMILISLHRDE